MKLRIINKWAQISARPTHSTEKAHTDSHFPTPPSHFQLCLVKWVRDFMRPEVGYGQVRGLVQVIHGPWGPWRPLVWSKGGGDVVGRVMGVMFNVSPTAPETHELS